MGSVRGLAFALALCALAGCAGTDTLPLGNSAGPAHKTPINKPPVNNPKVTFNQNFVEGLYTNIDVENPVAVLDLVFGALRDTITIYPTEGYYYFRFNTRGRTYSGNLRLDASDRDKGILHLGYFKVEDYGRYDVKNQFYKAFTSKDGVVIKRRTRFAYAVSYKGRTVTFRLNDIGWKPPRRAKLRKVEVYIGPVFDESGSRFHLIFDTEANHFLYVLNEDGVAAERFITIDGAVVVGDRTGFAYYVDRRYARKVLVAINGDNARKNNYYDGPFDQLPDLYVARSKLGEYLIRAYPQLKGKIDKYGNFKGRDGERFAIISYKTYYTDKQLRFVRDCHAKEKTAPGFYSCITTDDPE